MYESRPQLKLAQACAAWFCIIVVFRRSVNLGIPLVDLPCVLESMTSERALQLSSTADATKSKRCNVLRTAGIVGRNEGGCSKTEGDDEQL